MNRPPSETETISVYIEARPGISKERLQSALEAANVSAISEVVPGILSARIPSTNIRALEAVATVEVMQQKFMR